MIGYELSTGKFRDFGVIRKGFTIYSAINVDKINKKLYVLSVPFAKNDIENDSSHLFQIDFARSLLEGANKLDCWHYK